MSECPLVLSCITDHSSLILILVMSGIMAVVFYRSHGHFSITDISFVTFADSNYSRS